MQKNNTFKAIYSKANKLILCHKKYYILYVEILKKFTENEAKSVEFYSINTGIWNKVE